MDRTPKAPDARQVIESYGAGRFRISGQSYAGSVIVLPEHTTPWPVTDMAMLSLESLAEVLAVEPPVEILLIGSGAQMAPVPADLRTALRAQGVGCDAMDTGAACRTFNVLVAEARRVAAALVALPPRV